MPSSQSDAHSGTLAGFLVFAVTWWGTVAIMKEAAKLNMSVALSLLTRDGPFRNAFMVR